MIINLRSTRAFAKREAGGKGYNLYLLSHEGLRIPDWMTLGVSVFKQFRTEAKLDQKIGELIKKFTAQNLFSQAEEEIKSLILNTPLPSEIEKKVKEIYLSLCGDKESIAVRSSAQDEDSRQHSFAGQFSTFLFVNTEKEAIDKMKECWASGYSARSLSYRSQGGMDLTQPVQVAVVFQKMINCEKSGVLFTCDPIKQDPDKIMINSVYGMGEGLVSGLLEADTFLLDKATGRVLSSEMAHKKSKLVQKNISGLEEVEVCVFDQNKPSLSPQELRDLHLLSNQVEKFYGQHQDIEWGIENGHLFLLQSRPVTTPIQNNDGLLYVWDNSNIVESYGGITLPLTFTFAHHVYHSVYVQFCEILLIPQREIRQMDYFLRNMIGIFEGRVYYNLLNWYKLTSILPGFKYNRSFMETMMGTDQALSDEIAERIKPSRSKEKNSTYIRRHIRLLITGLKFLYFHFTIQQVVDHFLSYFHSVYDHYRKLDFDQMRANEAFGVYQELERKLLLEWKAPIINDYLCMVHFGILKKLTGLWLAHLGPSYQNDLLCGEGSLESAEPTRELIRLAAFAEVNPSLKKIILETSPENCLENLAQSEYSEFYARVLRYIDLYGFRCMNEMKLEERDLYQDPSFLFVCLKNYLKAGLTDLRKYEVREKEIRVMAEKKLREHLKGFKLFVYRWSLNHARLAVKNRENTRFCRTRIYGIVRALFNTIGRDFVGQNCLLQISDIFYLELSELSGALEGTLPVSSLQELVALRKSAYKKYALMDRPSRFITRGPVYWRNDPVIDSITSDKATSKDGVDRVPLAENELQGVGCCSGVVEGRVKVVHSPSDNLELNKEILVTVRTDPGWIPLYPSVSGLLVERGGLLSHSAIVAREMGLPTIVGVQGLLSRLKEGTKIRMNGETGIIQILDNILDNVMKEKNDTSLSV